MGTLIMGLVVGNVCGAGALALAALTNRHRFILLGPLWSVLFAVSAYLFIQL